MSQTLEPEKRLNADFQKLLQSMDGDGTTDYEKYLNTSEILGAQKKIEDLCNEDELQFLTIHQVEELWMKLINYSLSRVIIHMKPNKANYVTHLMGRVHRIQRMMINQLEILETMSPKNYQTIRVQLGNGSGQESPGFRHMLRLAPYLWESFEENFLSIPKRSIEMIYNSSEDYTNEYLVAESLAEFDELFSKFLFNHIKLIQRSIGDESKSLKGRPIEMLKKRIFTPFFPELWKIRSQMTESWGSNYGFVRESL